MQFCIQLSAYYPDKTYGGDRVYADMLELARCADRSGYESVAITEHHLLNILMMPAPLQFAVKIAGQTHSVKIITAVSVLPLHDMRVLAGELDGGCNPRLNRFIHAQLPDSRLVILERYRHSLIIEASDKLLPHLREFLLGINPA